MSNGCHRQQRAQAFKRSNYVSHIPKGMVNKDEASHYISKFESYFESLAAQRPYESLSEGSRGYIRLREGSRELQVEISGNSHRGSLVIRSGLSSYSEIHFSPRAIHVYRSEHEAGPLGQEAAIYLSRQLPNASFSFGTKSQVEGLIKSI